MNSSYSVLQLHSQINEHVGGKVQVGLTEPYRRLQISVFIINRN